MTIETAFALMIAMIISAAIPGPGVFACIAKSISSGFKASIYIILGIVSGNVIFLLFAILGLSAVAQMLGEMFLIIKWAGGAYLFWLGWKMWNTKPEIQSINKIHNKGRGSGFIGGLFIPFSNPKVILFYVSLLPSFVELSTLKYHEIFLVALLIAFALILVLTTYSFIASCSRQMLTSYKVMRNINRGAGLMMMGTGTVVAFESN